MKKIVLFFSALLMFGFSSLSLADIKISILDVNKVLTSLPQLKVIQTELKKKFDPRGQEVVNLQNAFRGDLDKYRQNSTNLQGEALKKEQQKIIDENRKLQETRVSLQRDLVAEQNQAVMPILQQIEGVVGKIAKDQKIDLVITKASTAYSNPQFDITDQVITEMKKQPMPVAKPTKPEKPVALKAEASKSVTKP